MQPTIRTAVAVAVVGMALAFVQLAHAQQPGSLPGGQPGALPGGPPAPPVYAPPAYPPPAYAPAAAVPAAAPVAPAAAPADRARKGFVGLLLRPMFCMNCTDPVTGSNNVNATFTFGPEFGSTLFALAIRYGYKDGIHGIFPDLRFFWDFKIKFIALTPLFEITPQFAYNGDLGTKALVLMLRPGFRVSFVPHPAVWIFVEDRKSVV